MLPKILFYTLYTLKHLTFMDFPSFLGILDNNKPSRHGLSSYSACSILSEVNVQNLDILLDDQFII